MNGNYKYKIPEKILNKDKYDNDIENIFDFFKESVDDLIDRLFKIEKFKNWELLDFNEIDFYLVSQLYKSGFCFNFKLPKFNDLLKSIINNKMK